MNKFLILMFFLLSSTSITYADYKFDKVACLLAPIPTTIPIDPSNKTKTIKTSVFLDIIETGLYYMNEKQMKSICLLQKRCDLIKIGDDANKRKSTRVAQKKWMPSKYLSHFLDICVYNPRKLKE